MASEIFSAKESNVPKGLTGAYRSYQIRNEQGSAPMTRSRRQSAVTNAKVEPSEGTTSVYLGQGQTATFNVHYINREQGTITGTLNMKGGSGSNRFRFGGNTGMSFDEALAEVKKDLNKNMFYYE